MIEPPSSPGTKKREEALRAATARQTALEDEDADIAMEYENAGLYDAGEDEFGMNAEEEARLAEMDF